MKRRDFISTLAVAVPAWPLSTWAQQPTMPVIGFLHAGAADQYATYVAAFLHGLKETGHNAGQNVIIEFRWAEGRTDRLGEFAAGLVQHKVNLIVAIPLSSALAAKAATASIPIVFEGGSDPVSAGLVPSLSNRSGGNVTGVSNIGANLIGKHLEMMHELLPNAKTIAVLLNSKNSFFASDLREAKLATTSLGLELVTLEASTEIELDAVFSTIASHGIKALVVGTDPFLVGRRDSIAAHAIRNAIATIHVIREFAVAGGLISYGPSFSDAYRLAGVYAGRILNGERAADLPVQLPTKFELVVNLKTARTLGLAISEQFLQRADEVIE